MLKICYLSSEIRIVMAVVETLLPIGKLVLMRMYSPLFSFASSTKKLNSLGHHDATFDN